MSADETSPVTLAPTAEAQEGGDTAVRYDRPALIGFIGDAATEQALRDGLADLSDSDIDLRRGGTKAAIAAMRKQTTPRSLIIDISGDDQPLNTLGELAQVVEPDVRVLLIGEIASVDFYRAVTRGLGAAEYLTKPLSRDVVARHFLPLVDGGVRDGVTMPGRRAIAVTAGRGGAGASTIAVNLAWYLGVTMRRHTVILDPDVQFGTTALLLNVQPGPGLRMALETPDRIDGLLAERAALPVADRLHLLASEEKLDIPFRPALGAASAMLGALRSRYNFVVADVPPDDTPLYRNLLDAVDQRVLVTLPTLASVRDTLRLLALPSGIGQMERPVVVLNRSGLTGGLTRREVEDALRRKIDIVIPDLPRQIGGSATMGEPALTTSSAFRSGIVGLAQQVAAAGLVDAIDPTLAGGQKSKRRGLFSFRSKRH